ncbi:MFS transporter [Butyrivibrio sp. CB08]|uniref:MFS transporter n=1 Tax=Butyrivibrio sp. CB08 TaxID=2364879 RepID=UPI000EA89922|nr:MFS transporter [Butyrivibrio sp. CB08]RKM61030.1 MFS transporter [Butyrivibrio sp. CB08]
MKLNYRRTILIGLAFLSITAFWQFYDNEIPRILKYTFNLGETATGAVMAMDNVFALVLLPLFGALSDKSSTKFGKRMPFIIIGTFLSVALFLILMLVAKPSGNVFFFFIVLLLLLVAMGTYRSPAVSLMPDLTPAPLRSSANAVINLMGALGGVFILVMTMLVLDRPENPADTNYTGLVLSLVICMIVSIVVMIFTINENKIKKQIEEEGGLGSLGDQIDDDEKEIQASKGKRLPADVMKSLAFLLISVAFWFMAYNAVTTAFTRYVSEVWGPEGGSYAGALMVATVAAVLSYIPIGILSSKLGRKKVILAGVLLMSFCYLSVSFMVTYSPLLNLFFVLIGVGWAAINVNSYPMVVEMSKAGDIGKYTGTYYTFSMAAQVFTPILSGLLLENISYRTLFPYAFVFSTLAFFTMLMVKHGDSKPEAKKNIIEHFDVDD